MKEQIEPKKDSPIPLKPCPRCQGIRETAYDIITENGETITVSEAFHLCEKHFTEWNDENYQQMC